MRVCVWDRAMESHSGRSSRDNAVSETFRWSALCMMMVLTVFITYAYLLTFENAVKLAVVSNFDSRLRNLLKDLDVLHLFDAFIISSEVGYEKPDEKIFRAALDRISVETRRAVHVGDDTKADKEGANAAGIDCWLWGKDVNNFSDIQNRILLQSES